MHNFPAYLGEKPIQITLKGANNERIERKAIKAGGNGVIEDTFDIPAVTTQRALGSRIYPNNRNSGEFGAFSKIHDIPNYSAH